ncbi:MAG: DUF5667 domain-containing protein [Candidatus Falkowbacteria bacterium]|nr:DUF5667 domain-containing protein [Candidatus Falkowbacteria bacterium]
MKEQNLTEQLTNLQAIKPDTNWKTSNREILVSQIYGSQVEPSAQKGDWVFYFQLPLMMARNLSQPTLVAILIFVFLTSGAIASVKMAENTKPGDSFYIAKIISEKTQLAFTFNDKGKAKLGLEFATNRVEEMNKILTEPGSQKDQQVEQLVNNIKDQIKEVKTRIAKINPSVSSGAAKGTSQAVDNMVFSANLNKENQGIQISEPVTSTTTNSQEISKPASEKAITTSTELIVGSEKATSTAVAPANSTNSTVEILAEAGQLLNEDKYDATLQKLDEADKSVTQVEQGEVKGESESATSTVK